MIKMAQMWLLQKIILQYSLIPNKMIVVYKDVYWKKQDAFIRFIPQTKYI